MSRIRERLAIQVCRSPLLPNRGRLIMSALSFPCAVGRSGFTPRKTEGDGGTPIGKWSVRQIFFRADRSPRPQTSIPARAIRPADGWCDAPWDGNYNRLVTLPYGASAERLWRDDHLYDLIAVLGYNDHPRIQGRGSAIFMHVAHEGFSPTEGCVALEEHHLRLVIRNCGLRTLVAISG